MAKRGATPRARPGPRGRDAGFEIEDQDVPAKAPPGIESGLVFVTFAALLIGIIIAQIELSATFGAGWLG